MQSTAEVDSDDIRYEGDVYADVYDAWYENKLDTTAALNFLALLAPSGRTLELGVGTGRLAIPLALRGFDVTGVDNSKRMLARLSAKAGGHHVHGVLADMRAPSVTGPFDVAYVVFSSLFLLPDQQAQLQCFRSVASVLADDGVFVVEAFVPDPTRYQRHQSVSVENLAPSSARIELAEHDSAAQVIRATRIEFAGAGVQYFPYQLRYATPAELDLMAQLAGLTLRSRFGGFDGREFTRESQMHVSVYVRVGKDIR